MFVDALFLPVYNDVYITSVHFGLKMNEGVNNIMSGNCKMIRSLSYLCKFYMIYTY